MKKHLTLLILVLSLATTTQAQTVSGFEELFLPIDTFATGNGAVVAFRSGNARFPIDYNTEFNSWTGWAISTKTDATTPGFSNQYSAITGGGYDDSDHYAVGYVLGQNIIRMEDEAVGEAVFGFYVTNGTYPYLSMLEGDGFAKKFGGATGEDPDFFKLTIKKYLNGQLGPDSVDFYLADYRFEDHSQDYIIDEWTYVDLVSLGAADSLVLTLSSSDVGQFGMNTPAYFCIDNFITSDGVPTPTEEQLSNEQFRVYPNPATDYVHIVTESINSGEINLFNKLGTLLHSEKITGDQTQLDLSRLPAGTYILQLKSEAGTAIQHFIKH